MTISDHRKRQRELDKLAREGARLLNRPFEAVRDEIYNANGFDPDSEKPERKLDLLADVTKPVTVERTVCYESGYEWLSEVPAAFLKALGTMPTLNRTLGPQVCWWIENRCIFGEGDKYGQPVILIPAQRALFYKLYEINDVGSRRYRFALLSLGKGSGKTPIGGWIEAVELAGPCIFGGWKEDGTPKGVRRNSPDIINVASSYEQADMILDEARVTFTEGPLAPFADAQKGLIQLKNGIRGKARRMPTTARKADGTKATTLLIDEAHEIVTEKQEAALAVLTGGTAKRADSFTVVFSTAGNDLNTWFGKQFARGMRGDFGEHELFVYLCADEKLDPTKDEDIVKGIKQSNPLAMAGVADINSLLYQFKGMPLFRAKRYFWNLWVSTDESWLPAGAWDANKGEVKLDPDLPTWVGADMALKRDSAAVLILQELPNGKFQATSKIWFPQGQPIDQTECDDYIRNIVKIYNVHWIAADEAYWITLPQLEAEGLPIFRMPQQGKNMILAYARTYRMIVDGLITHDGAPDFSDQITSAAPHTSSRGWTLKKGPTHRRIDSAPALAGAVFASTIPVPEPDKKPSWTIY